MAKSKSGEGSATGEVLLPKKRRGSKRSYPARQSRQYLVDKSINVAHERLSSGVFRIPQALSQIRALCRHLVHTNVHAKRAVSIRTSHFVGIGIKIHISCDDEQYARAFHRWSTSFACDFEGRKNLYGLQDLLVKSENEAGEGIAIIRDFIDESGDIWPNIQIIDPDMIAEQVRAPHNPGALVRQGVEYDDRGRVLGMHVKRSADDDAAAGGGYSSALDAYFVPYEDILHFFEPLYAGQLRGIPRGTQVLSTVSDFDVLFRAILSKAQAEACFGLAVKRVPNDSEMNSYDPNSDAEDDDGGLLPIDNIEPGLIYYLRDGEEIQAINPSSSGTFEPYARISLEAICTGFGITYSQGSGDLSRVNYSSEKAGRAEFNRGIDSLRSLHFEPLMLRIERRFRDAYILNIQPDMRDSTPGVAGHAVEDMDPEERIRAVERADVTLIPPARERIDPQKEALVEITELQSGALTWRQYILSHGKDPDMQIKALLKEREELGALGLNLTFGAVTTKEALSQSVAQQDAQDALEANSTLFDRRAGR